MNNSNTNKRKFEIQEILSLGYVYLLVLGILYNAIYYNFLGVNILEYSSVLDVLISPVSILLSQKTLFIIVIAAIFIIYLHSRLMPKFLKKARTLEKNQNEKKLAKIDKQLEAYKSNKQFIFLTALMVFSMFIGVSLGLGYKRSKQVANNELKESHEIVFNDGTSKQIKLLGKNSLNIIYAEIGNTDILISPIEGNIKTITKIAK